MSPHSPDRKAAALAYTKSDYAPRLVAKGHGPVAEAIIALAHESGVFVHESPELVDMLMKVDLDRDIPPELYQAVAEILAWIYWLEMGGEGAVPPR
jgi:flagellar biosynthesis protein